MKSQRKSSTKHSGEKKIREKKEEERYIRGPGKPYAYKRPNSTGSLAPDIVVLDPRPRICLPLSFEKLRFLMKIWKITLRTRTNIGGKIHVQELYRKLKRNQRFLAGTGPSLDRSMIQ